MSGEAEIADFELISFGANQQIFGLDISMHHVLGVKVIHSFQKLVDKEFDTVAIQAIRFFF